MATIKFVNARIIDEKSDYIGEVVVKDGIITECGADLSQFQAEKTYDIERKVLMPAFVDMHCHLRDPGYTYKESLESGMKAGLKGGYAVLTAMANTNPVISTAELVQVNLDKAKSLNLLKLVQACSAGTDLLDYDLVDFESVCKVTNIISNDGKTIFRNDFMRNLLIASQKYGFIVSTHCMPETDIVQRDLALLAEVGGNLHIGHISLESTMNAIIKAKNKGLKFTCEVTPHHLIWCDNDYKVNPPLASDYDVQALVEGIKNGYVDCCGTDHAPHSKDDKKAGMPGISNIEYAFSVYNNVFNANKISLNKLSQMLSRTPRKILNLEGGLIEKGQVADIVIADVNANTFISVNDMISLSTNTPFNNKKTLGKILMTVVDGEIRYDNGEVRDI